MARDRKRYAQGTAGVNRPDAAAAPHVSCPVPEDRAAYLDLIRALARAAARADHAREREDRPN